MPGKGKGIISGKCSYLDSLVFALGFACSDELINGCDRTQYSEQSERLACADGRRSISAQ